MTAGAGTTIETSATTEQALTSRHGDIVAAIIAEMRPYAL